VGLLHAAVPLATEDRITAGFRDHLRGQKIRAHIAAALQSRSLVGQEPVQCRQRRVGPESSPPDRWFGERWWSCGSEQHMSARRRRLGSTRSFEHGSPHYPRSGPEPCGHPVPAYCSRGVGLRLWTPPQLLIDAAQAVTAASRQAIEQARRTVVRAQGAIDESRRLLATWPSNPSGDDAESDERPRRT